MDSFEHETMSVSKQARDFLRSRQSRSVASTMEKARASGRILLQPRCGVGSHEQQLALLKKLSEDANPDVATITIDSYTRLGAFDKAHELARTNPAMLNGYPLVAHGAERLREMVLAIEAPIQIRHGSPDPRRLFSTSLEGGADGFEGGPLSYTLPYSKDFPLERSLRAWDIVDEVCGELAEDGINIDREFFGSLSGTLVHPVISLSVTFIEAMKAFSKGANKVGIAISQSGCPYQDIAGLRAIELLATSLCPGKTVFPILHHFMGVFPRDPTKALALIAQGSVTARLGKATKVVVKTQVEALGIPSADANARAINFSRIFFSSIFDGFLPDNGKIDEEAQQIYCEVKSLVSMTFEHGDSNGTIANLFAEGRLDVPFCPSRYCKGLCVPRRADDGAIRIVDPGLMSFSRPFLDREMRMAGLNADPMQISAMIRDIQYFSGEDDADSQ
ncbi:methylaspartate mutase [Rhizobiales bacterium]|uniref:methylaspartate mutase n=1 Tax=Rhizobium sp. 11_C7_N12_5 TaxID=3240770 RepID=UPI0013AFDD5A